MKTAKEIAEEYFGDARGGDENIIEVMELYGKEIKQNIEFDKDKLIEIIEEIWNAGYETDISITNEKWISKIKSCIK